MITEKKIQNLLKYVEKAKAEASNAMEDSIINKRHYYNLEYLRAGQALAYANIEKRIKKLLK